MDLERDQTPGSAARWFAPAVVSRTPFVGAAVAIGIALLAFLAGANQLALSALALSLTAIVTERAVALDQTRTARRRRADEERNHRETVEKLADRMWELSESEERFRGLVDALGDIVVHRSQTGRIVFANRALSEVTGIEPRDLVGRRLEEIGFAVPAAATTDGLDGQDIRHMGPRGARWFSWVELSTRDEATGAVQRRAIGRDITERKASEEVMIAARLRAESGSAAKSRFLATVSHEIRTPLNGIMGMAKLIADTELSDEQRTYATAISTSGAALLDLIDDLLDFSRIEAGRLDLAPESVSPREIAESVAELLSARAYAKGIGLGLTVAPDVPSLLTCDPGKLRQVLVNLVGNAIKFTNTGGVAIAVARGGTGDRLCFSVEDTGHGIAETDVARIFEDFEQADGSTTRTHGGAGLGLAISRRIAEAMGGSITVTSTPGEGSIFGFYLPIRNPVAAAPADSLGGHRVLVLLPDAIEAGTVAKTIRDRGGKADVVTNREAALAALRNGEAYDLVLAGAAYENEIAALRATAPGSRFLALLTPSERGRLEELRKAGCDGYLVRPVRLGTLLRMVGGQAPQKSSSVDAVEWRQARPQGAALSILVAEDNPLNALLVRSALGKAGHAVDVVGDGRAAVEAVARRRFDIVLMDLHMPEMDGLDAIAHIRSREEAEGKAPVPILVLTADGQEETRRLAIAHGANGVVVKPLDPLVLIATVEEQAA